MKKVLSTLAAFAMLGLLSFASPATAGSDCCPVAKTADAGCSVEKVAAADCSVEKVASADKVAKAGCAASGCAMEAGLQMAKGGADSAAVQVGYGLDQQVPDFTLTDTTGKEHKLSKYGDKIKVLVFYNQECPWVVEPRERLSAFADKYKEKGVVFLAIDPGINNSPEAIAEEATQVSFPILVNRDSMMARHFKATRTPEVFILDKNNVVVYTGQFDSGERKDENGKRMTPTEDAVKALLAGEEIQVRQTRAFGCTIKFNPVTAQTETEESQTGT